MFRSSCVASPLCTFLLWAQQTRLMMQSTSPLFAVGRDNSLVLCNCKLTIPESRALCPIPTLKNQMSTKYEISPIHLLQTLHHTFTLKHIALTTCYLPTVHFCITESYTKTLPEDDVNIVTVFKIQYIIIITIPTLSPRLASIVGHTKERTWILFIGFKLSQWSNWLILIGSQVHSGCRGLIIEYGISMAEFGKQHTHASLVLNVLSNVDNCVVIGFGDFKLGVKQIMCSPGE